MLLHTIVDLQEVLVDSAVEKNFYKKVENCILEGVQYKDGMILRRVISTNPKDYLSGNYTLGSPF